MVGVVHDGGVRRVAGGAMRLVEDHDRDLVEPQEAKVDESLTEDLGRTDQDVIVSNQLLPVRSCPLVGGAPRAFCDAGHHLEALDAAARSLLLDQRPCRHQEECDSGLAVAALQEVFDDAHSHECLAHAGGEVDHDVLALGPLDALGLVSTELYRWPRGSLGKEVRVFNQIVHGSEDWFAGHEAVNVALSRLVGVLLCSRYAEHGAEAKGTKVGVLLDLLSGHSPGAAVASARRNQDGSTRHL
eukprot:scaffold6847_cov64-Phaeocystis_antarctica.AAC.3